MANEHKKKVSFIFSVRFLLTCLLFWAVAIQFTHKTDISVGILCMVNHTAVDKNTTDFDYSSNNGSNKVKCLAQNTSSQTDKDGPFIWNKEVQEHIIGSYFYGYLFSQVPAGWIAYKFGAKIVLFISILLGSIGTILIPVCANASYFALIVCRFLTGLAEGAIWPAMTNVWSHWAPNAERGRMIAFSASGSQVGTVLGFSLGGYLCVHGFDGGWPSIFYIFGGAGIIWCLLWLLLVSDSPLTHKFIKDEEKEYIIDEIHEEHIKIKFV